MTGVVSDTSNEISGGKERPAGFVGREGKISSD